MTRRVAALQFGFKPDHETERQPQREIDQKANSKRMQKSFMSYLELWLPLCGGGVFLAVAISAWFADRQIVAIWFAFVGGILLLLLATLQIQEAILASKREVTKTLQASPNVQVTTQQRAFIVVIYPNQKPQVTDLPIGKGLAVSFQIKNLGNVVGIVNGIEAHIYLSEEEPDLSTAVGQSTKEDFSMGGSRNPYASTMFLRGDRVLIDPGTVYDPQQQLFVAFKEDRIKAINGPILHYSWIASHLWLRVIVSYSDAYHSGWETSYWVQLAGTSTLAAKQQQFNYQK